MTINKIDVDKNKTTLSFNRHEILIIRRALQKMSEELTTEDDKWLLVEMSGVDDVMKDGNFTRFLSFYRVFVENENKTESER